MKWLVYIYSAMELLCGVLGGHIIIIHFIPVSSFMTLLNGIVNTLATQHNITIYSIHYTEYPHPNVSVIKINAPPVKTHFSQGLFEKACTDSNFLMAYNTITYLNKEYIDAVFNDKSIQTLLKTKEKYDLLMTSASMSESFFQFVHLLQVPFIQIAPTIPFTFVNDLLGKPAFVTTNPNFINFEESYSFANRIKIYIHNCIAHLGYNWHYLPYVNSITTKYFPPKTPRIDEIIQNVSMVFVNTNNALGYATPNPPHMVDIGGIYCKPAKPLASDLEDFIQGSGEHGIIYLSFGSSIKSKFPEHIKTMLVNVFAKLPQRVLWKWNDATDNFPPNVRVSKWFSQENILGHNKTKLFVTQAGIFSVQESVYHGVPLLAIPIALDQHYNGLLAKQMGYGEMIDFCKISEEILFDKIQQMILNSKYKANVGRISKLMKEELENVEERLLSGVNYVIRHNGNPIIHQLPDRFTGFQKMDADIVSFLTIICLAVLGCSIYVSYLLLIFINRVSNRTQKEKHH